MMRKYYFFVDTVNCISIWVPTYIQVDRLFKDGDTVHGITHDNRFVGVNTAMCFSYERTKETRKISKEEEDLIFF